MEKLCVKKITSTLEKLGFSHAEAVSNAWEILLDFEKKNETPNWDGGNLDDPNRARDKGLKSTEKKKGDDDRAARVERCVKDLKAKGKSKESSFKICNSTVK